MREGEREGGKKKRGRREGWRDEGREEGGGRREEGGIERERHSKLFRNNAEQSYMYMVDCPSHMTTTKLHDHIQVTRPQLTPMTSHLARTRSGVMNSMYTINATITYTIDSTPIATKNSAELENSWRP